MFLSFSNRKIFSSHVSCLLTWSVHTNLSHEFLLSSPLLNSLHMMNAHTVSAEPIQVSSHRNHHRDSLRSHIHKHSSEHKPTRVRTVLNEKQLQTLRNCYNQNPRPDALMKEQLVEMTGLSPRVIRVWFQNKRCKDKKRSILMKQIQQQEKVSHPFLVILSSPQPPWAFHHSTSSPLKSSLISIIIIKHDFWVTQIIDWVKRAIFIGSLSSRRSLLRPRLCRWSEW